MRIVKFSLHFFFFSCDHVGFELDAIVVVFFLSFVLCCQCFLSVLLLIELVVVFVGMWSASEFYTRTGACKKQKPDYYYHYYYYY